jgi:hypothetical protein
MREYTVMIDGLPHTMQLSDEDARREGAVPVDTQTAETKQAEPKPNKARTPKNKAS